MTSTRKTTKRTIRPPARQWEPEPLYLPLEPPIPAARPEPEKDNFRGVVIIPSEEEPDHERSSRVIIIPLL